MATFAELKEQKYRKGRNHCSDIVEHLPVLERYASQCQHVTEFGVRDGCSTVALCSGCRGEVHSYDIRRTPFVDAFLDIEKPCLWTFHQGNTAGEEIEVAETDLLFVDTLHTYAHVSRELALWGRKAGCFLAFHDTFTCGEKDRSGPKPDALGILPAIQEFLDQYPGEYQSVYRTDANNGLWILERVRTCLTEPSA